jgi:glycosyltransferase involved in cell wall biosynthesis
MAPKVSVIVASYNNGRFLPACLGSLVQQTYVDFEVLVVDDCSTDNSLEIAQAYSQSDSRIRAIRTERNQGVTNAKHLGLEAARGEYVAILDSDDVSCPQRLEKQVAWLDSHPADVLVAGAYGVINADGKIVKRRKKVPADDVSIRWRLTFGNCLIHSAVMYRRMPAIDSGGYDPYYFHGEDLDIYSKLLRVGKFAALPEVVCYYRRHRASVTKYVAAEERERYYVELAQRSIRWQTNQKVDIDVAAAVFYNTKRPAISEDAFLAGIETMIRALDHFYQEGVPNNADRKQLARCFIQHLIRLRKRNRNQSWWSQGYRQWFAALHYLVQHCGYRWHFDRKLLVKLQLAEFFQLAKASFFH